MNNTEHIDFPRLSDLLNEIKREEEKHRYNVILRSTISILIVVVAIAILIATLWLPVLQIYGVSMVPTLTDGDIVLAVKSTDLKRGDMVAFYYGNKLLIKRCIAGPGEIVNIDKEGNVYVNNEYIVEPYIKEKAFGECDLKLPYQVPDGKWFLIGDSRATSVDSRNSDMGCVSQEQLVGKVVYRVWPLNKIGVIH